MSKEKKHKKGLTAFGIIVLVLILILAIIIGGTYWYINSKLSKLQKVDIDENDLNVSAQAEEQLADYRNIAIFGIDSREDTYDKGNRSDCIIIASINNKTKDVKLVSVYRDTYVQIEGHGLDKITHAYSYGEAPLAIKTLNTNLDLNIKEFVTVNFDAVKEIIDDIGGISMNITAEEVPHISGITKAGTYNLTGEQARPGKDEKIFTLYKFRTMTDKKDEKGNLLPDSQRLTKFGKFLRSTSLDELPELINIIKGDMSIVGPRPQLVRDMLFMTDEQRKRHSVRQGLTGLAQANGRNNITWEDKLNYDLEYIQNITFIGDLKLILKTVLKVFRKDDINTEGMDTAEDLCDYLLRTNKITEDEYKEKLKM